MAEAFELTSRDVVVDIGCGTGQLTLPLAPRVRAVVGMDPEPDMLALARRAAGAANLLNTSWVLGADTDVPALAALLGQRSVAAATVGTALHWMRPEDLFPALVLLLRPGGGVLTNGVPLWSQDSDWSRRLRQFLRGWLGHRHRPAVAPGQPACPAGRRLHRHHRNNPGLPRRTRPRPRHRPALLGDARRPAPAAGRPARLRRRCPARPRQPAAVHRPRPRNHPPRPHPVTSSRTRSARIPALTAA